ncbi:beta strand repeat-containing protein [Candidatus Reidiella endopervernicosa]|uniref:Uncharacterized protein n=1 Tax=Candidatus Reidiella endopervernicosa TaxID=2738883 RepID=A0A6N0HUH9_9GAMM|nr:hypothetical protein [Candidatus Reidiella endopervernicosa]QKQ26062.1 hypothetical protein HUE57_07025 [Candidatus Reidiella endopervernicosa]
MGSDVSISVTALSSGNDVSGYGILNNAYGGQAVAFADLTASADSGSVVIGGGVVVAADAESASNEVYVSDYGDAYASAVARADGYIHADDDVVIGADVEISAEADSSNNSAYVSSDDAIVSAYGVAYGAVISSNGNVSITGDFEVAASADATGNEAYGDDDAAAGATAVAFGNILAYNSVVVEGVSVTADAAASSNFASADDFVNAGAGALAYGLVLAEHGSVTASGDVGFSAAADANSNTIHSEYGAAHAGAIGYSRGFVTADTGVTIDGDLSFGADATAADNVVMAYGIGDDAGANGLAVAIGMASASDGSVVIGGDAMLSADAETRGNSVEADEDAFANAYGIGVMGLHAQDDILIGGDLLASGVVSASNNDVDGSSNGIAGATGTLFVTTEADEGNVEVTGVVDLTLDVDSVSNNANSYVGAFAYGVVNLEGANTILNSGASVSVEALSSANDGTNARAYGMGMLYANADGGADTGDLTLTGGVTVDGNAYAYSNSASFTTASANAGAVLTADENLTLTGDIDVSASAENNHDGSVFANAYMSAVAGTGSASGDLVIYDDVAVSAHVDSESGSNSAIAYGTASIYALHDVKVEGDIDVEVTVDKDTVVGGYGYALADIAAGTNGSSGTSADGDVFLLGTARTMVDSVDEQVVEDAHTRVQTTGGDIYLLGYDPIADATPAYLQTHVTDEDVSGDSRARVTITPNGGDTVWGYTEDWEHMLVLESTWQGVILKTPYDPMGQLPPLSIGPNGEIQFNNGIADPNLAEEFCNRFSKFSCETGDAL